MVKVGDYEIEGKVLYDADGILIAQNPRATEDHDVVLNGKRHFYMPRGVLEELARSNRKRTRDALDIMLNGTLSTILNDSGITFDGLRVAFAQARIQELSD